MTVKASYDRTWQSKQQIGLDVGLLEMATDIDARAKILAPKQTRALVNSGRITKVTGGYSVSFGDSKVPYARLRHFENKKNPQTLGYLAKAGDGVVRGNISKYFRNI